MERNTRDFTAVIDDALRNGQIRKDKAERLRRSIVGLEEGSTIALVQVAWDLLQECVKTELDAAKAKKTSEGASPGGQSKESQLDDDNTEYIWDESFLNYLVEKLNDDRDLHFTEKNVQTNIVDLISEEDFPHHLTPKRRGASNPFVMPPQGLCPPWVSEIAPYVLRTMSKRED